MTRVLVVSDDQDRTVDDGAGTEAPALPATLYTWLTSGPHDIDALILDLAGPGPARAAVAKVRGSGLNVPIVLVAGEAAEWNAPELQLLPRCVLLPSPVDPQALRDAVSSFYAIDNGSPEHQDFSLRIADTAVPPLGERVTEYRVTRRARRGGGGGGGGGGSQDKRPVSGGSSLSPVSVSGSDTTVQARDGPLPPPALPPSPPAHEPSQPAEDTSPPPVSALGLVRALTRRVSELDGVATTSDVIVKGAAERTGADAAVVLLPDQGRWRVAAGLGLRPVETRFELPEDSWLVREIALSAQGLIIEDTDIARSRLRGAPLASWRHLMAAPIPGVGAALLLARKNDPPFDEASLSQLVEVAKEAAPLLAAAVEVRGLARLLDGFRDQD